MDGTSTQPIETTTPEPASTGGAVTQPTAPKITPTPTPKSVVTTPSSSSTLLILPNDTPPSASGFNYVPVFISTVLVVSLGTFILMKLNSKKKKDKKDDRKCLNLKKLMEDKLNELTNLKGQLQNKATNVALAQLPKMIEATYKDYERLKELYEKCITDVGGKSNVFIFHGTEGYPEENWLTEVKAKLENKGYKVFESIENNKKYIDSNSLFIGRELYKALIFNQLNEIGHKVKPEKVLVSNSFDDLWKKLEPML